MLYKFLLHTAYCTMPGLSKAYSVLQDNSCSYLHQLYPDRCCMHKSNNCYRIAGTKLACIFHLDIDNNRQFGLLDLQGTNHWQNNQHTLLEGRPQHIGFSHIGRNRLTVSSLDSLLQPWQQCIELHTLCTSC